MQHLPEILVVLCAMAAASVWCYVLNLDADPGDHADDPFLNPYWTDDV